MQATIIVLTFLRFGEGVFRLDWLPVQPWAAGMLVAVVLAVLLRARAPWLFLAIAVAPSLMMTFGMKPPYSMIGLLIAVGFAAYSVAATRHFVSAVVAVTALWLILIVGFFLRFGLSVFHVFPGSVTAGLIIAVVLGHATFTRRMLIEATQKRALDAERTREAQTATKIAEHRLATARDLHDVVGHQIAVINLQAGVAHEMVRTSPEEALASIDVIRSSTQVILGEIAELLHELRSETGSSATPRARRVSALPGLARTLTAAGAPVDLRIADDVPELSPDIDETVYYMIEELMVNAYKHGAPGSTAEVNMERDADSLFISASNPVSAQRPRGGTIGLGVRGIEERARRLGGSSTAVADPHTFRLQIRLPLSTK